MSAFDRAMLYLRTLRNLRWEQWVYRPVRRLQSRLPVRVAPLVSASSSDHRLRLLEEVQSWGPGDDEGRLRRAEAVVGGEFRFLNHTETLARIDWSRRHVSHLWSYNLHYFDYALDLAWAFESTGDKRFADRFVALAEGWVAGNPVAKGDGWEPYAVSLRTTNWIYALLLLGDSVEPAARERLEASLALQLEYLSRRLELHILANHLQKNLKALVIGGLYFSGPAAERWLQNGTSMLWRELFEQVLPDGGHYERSPMYHAIALSDFLEVIGLLGRRDITPPADAINRVRKMVRALGALSDTRGRLHPFNDAAEGIAPGRNWLSRLAIQIVRENVPALEGDFSLPEMGYYGFVRGGDTERLIIDCGPLGPRYQAGHGHCDLLSFEWVVNGQPVVVDSGVNGYESDFYREYVRSTRAHNTVVIDEREQAEVWGTFRVGRHPQVKEASQRYSEGNFHFDGSYSPYYDAAVSHRRAITRDSDGLAIRDNLVWPGDRRAASFLHLHPDFDVRKTGSCYTATAHDLTVEIEIVGAEKVSIVRGARDPVQGWYCPQFGMAMPAPVIIAESEGDGGCEMSFLLRASSRGSGD